MDYPKKAKLTNISQYAQRLGITRDKVYERLKSGDLTAYEVEGEEGKTLLNLEEDPKVRPYSRDESKENS